MARNTVNPIRQIVDGMELTPNPDKEMIALSIGKILQIFLFNYVYSVQSEQNVPVVEQGGARVLNLRVKLPTEYTTLLRRWINVIDVDSTSQQRRVLSG